VESRFDRAPPLRRGSCRGEGWLARIKLGQTFRIEDAGNQAAIRFSTAPPIRASVQRPGHHPRARAHLSTTHRLLSNEGQPAHDVADTADATTPGGACAARATASVNDSTRSNMHSCRDTFCVRSSPRRPYDEATSPQHQLFYERSVTPDGGLALRTRLGARQYVECAPKWTCLLSRTVAVEHPCNATTYPVRLLIWGIQNDPHAPFRKRDAMSTKSDSHRGAIAAASRAR